MFLKIQKILDYDSNNGTCVFMDENNNVWLDNQGRYFMNMIKNGKSFNTDCYIFLYNTNNQKDGKNE